VVVAQLLAHGLQLSYGVLAPSVAWRYRVLITDTGTDIPSRHSFSCHEEYLDYPIRKGDFSSSKKSI
jgi:hypothetical protein